MTTPSPADRGRALEQRIAAYFAHHGYTVDTNRVLVGRSGGRHEIDVLAEKSDALTSFRVAVECKAWNSPIEKDVVSKLHYVMNDLGLNKGVVVSLAGARSGADTAAAQLGIDVWGPDQLRHHLGEGVFAEIAGPRPSMRSNGRAVDGWAFASDPDSARRAIETTGKGRLGLRTLEELVWFAPVWVPAYLVHLTVAQPTTRRLRHQVTSTYTANVYDALEGNWHGRSRGEPSEFAAGDAVVLNPLRRETQIHSALRKAVEGRLKVTSPAAVQRHEANLTRLGLPLPLHGVTIDQTQVVHLPVYAGLLQSQQDRVAVVDGITGRLDTGLGRVLTAQVSHLRNAYR